MISALRGIPRIEFVLVLVLAGLGATVYDVRFGGWHLDPTNIDWMLAKPGDAGTYLIGWTYFRHEPWSWPPGAIQDYMAPLGTSIAMVDAIPIAALPLKAVAPLLPEPFQYFGAWTLLNYLLQPIMAYFLLGHFVQRRSLRVLGAAFFLLMPAFLNRHGHIALSSHWLLIAGLALYFRMATLSLRTRWTAWGVLIFVSAGVHPYLTVMNLGIMTAATLRAAFVARRWRTAVEFGAIPLHVLITLMVFYLSGHFIHAGDGPTGTLGFGIYSMNLNAVFNPLGSSPIVKSLPTFTQGQYEGMNYAGLGLLALGTFATATLFASRSGWRAVRRHGALAFVLLLFFVYSASTTVTWGDERILRYTLPTSWEPLLAALRSSGRFYWPVGYAGLLFALWAASKTLNPRLATAFVATLLAVQAFDVQRFADTSGVYPEHYESPLRNPGWERAIAQVDTVFTLRAFHPDILRRSDYKHFGAISSRDQVPTTAGYGARVPMRAAAEFEETFRARLRSGNLPTNSLIVLLASDAAVSLRSALDHGWYVGRWDGYFVLLPPSIQVDEPPAFVAARELPLATYLDQAGDDVILFAVKDEATYQMSDADEDALRAHGVPVDDLVYRASFAGILQGDRFLATRIGVGRPSSLKVDAGETLAEWTSPIPIEIESAGFDAGNRARLVVDGKDWSLDQRGFNTVRVDSSGHVVELGVFDTHRGLDGHVLVRAPE